MTATCVIGQRLEHRINNAGVTDSKAHGRRAVSPFRGRSNKYQVFLWTRQLKLQ